MDHGVFITGPPNGPVLFCSLMSVVCRLSASSVVVCNAAGGRAGRPAAGRVGGRAADTARGGGVAAWRSGNVVGFDQRG